MKILAHPFFTALVLCGALADATVEAQAQSMPSAFTYQGRLLERGDHAHGRYDLRFELFATETAGDATGTAITNREVAVTKGLFTTRLDFGAGAQFSRALWLEIGVRPAGSDLGFVTLLPRQSLTPAPSALYTLRAESLLGPVSEAQLPTNIARLDAPQIFRGPVTFSGGVQIGQSNALAGLDVFGAVTATLFQGDGSALSNLHSSAVGGSQTEKAWRVAIPFVAVTNANNAPDANGKGAVAFGFRIGKFEINNNQYSAFLNAVGATDPNGLFSTNMAATEEGGIVRSGSPGDYSYTVKPGAGHRPVVWVDFRDAIRFCNWLHNGQPTGLQEAGTTEDGAYTITASALADNTLKRNPNARYWIPSDDEWYKAAYHQPASAGGPPGDYWLYPTGSNDAPVAELPPGDKTSANVCCETGLQTTDVGAYLNATTFYGTFDQAGNVQEWTEEIIFSTNRRLRGGSVAYNEFYAKSSDFEFDTIDYDSEAIGFRVAGTLLP